MMNMEQFYQTVLESPKLPRNLASLGGFDLVRKIGSGGMGVIFLAHQHDGPLRAIKLPSPELLDGGSRQQIERFRREQATTEAISRFQQKSPELAHLLVGHVAADEFHTSSGVTIPYLVMQHICGETAEEKLSRWGTLPQREVARICIGAAEALNVIHTKLDAPHSHRDVKPSNIFLDLPRGEGVCLADYGLAINDDHTPGELTKSTGGTPNICGSPGYIPHERWIAPTKYATCPKCDIFALGVSCYELLAGFRPYTKEELWTKSSPKLRVSDLRSGVDGDLAELIEAMISHDRDLRPESAVDVVETLTSLLPDLPFEETPEVSDAKGLLGPAQWPAFSESEVESATDSFATSVTACGSSDASPKLLRLLSITELNRTVSVTHNEIQEHVNSFSRQAVELNSAINDTEISKAHMEGVELLNSLLNERRDPRFDFGLTCDLLHEFRKNAMQFKSIWSRGLVKGDGRVNVEALLDSVMEYWHKLLELEMESQNLRIQTGSKYLTWLHQNSTVD